MLTITDRLPHGLLDTPAEQLHEILDGPTLIHLPGRRPQPLFVSVLLHGNEDTGYRAIQALLRKHHEGELPRALSIFVGNVAAARHRQRRLDGQPDYNRIWPGTEGADGPERQMMQQVVEEMRRRGVFASVDIHNNTGKNPHYACVNRLEQEFLHLATWFSRTVVYFLRPRGVQSMAFAELCPAVTLECGQVGQRHGTEHALEYLDACLHLAEFPTQPVAEHDIDLFHTVATVKIPRDVEFGFNETATELRLVDDLDGLNFQELPSGTVFGWTKTNDGVHFDVTDETGRAVTEHYFEVLDGEIRTRRLLMPSMLTTDAKVIRQDCLCYLMERYAVD